MENTQQSMSKSGNLNPMFGKRHTQETKKKISDSQKQRYQTIRKALEEQELIDYGDTSADARKDVLKRLLDYCNLNFENLQQAANFIAIMLGKDRIQEVVKAEINKVISECHKVGNDKKQQ